MGKRVILAGDLGGTKTNLAIVSAAAGIRSPLAEATFPSAAYQALEAIVCEFLAGTGYRPELAVFGVAGPVVAGRARITNLHWELDEKQLGFACNLPSVRLLNDLVATAYGVPVLRPEDRVVINQRKPVLRGAIGVIAPGTGLGEAFLVWDGSGYRAHPSEGGHADFAPTNDEQVELLKYLSWRLPHVSYEQLCSGRGMPNIYEYYKKGGLAVELESIAKELAATDDPTPVIVNGALGAAPPCELCRLTLNCFVSILGAEAGNLALKVLATGGIYLGGGIPPRIVQALTDGRFMEAFTRKGRMTELVAGIPVLIITNPKAALLGAAAFGLQLMEADG